MLCYEANWYGAELLTAPRSYPSTKRCASCGAVREELALSAP